MRKSVSKNIKFIVFGQSRSGSTLLVELLNSHPDVHCDGELFNKSEIYIRSRLLLKFFCRFPFLYIRYRLRTSFERAYGFKLFFFQVKSPEKLLKKLSRHGWKIISIRRENIIAQSLSNIIAFETNLWHRY